MISVSIGGEKYTVKDLSVIDFLANGYICPFTLLSVEQNNQVDGQYNKLFPRIKENGDDYKEKIIIENFKKTIKLAFELFLDIEKEKIPRLIDENFIECQLAISIIINRYYPNIIKLNNKQLSQNGLIELDLLANRYSKRPSDFLNIELNQYEKIIVDFLTATTAISNENRIREKIMQRNAQN